MTNIQTHNDALNNQNNITSIASGGEQLQKQVLNAFKTSTNKTLSPAFLKIKAHRDNINVGSVCWLADDLSSMVYTDERDGKIFAKGYRGRAKKLAFHNRFTTVDSREAYINQWMADRSKNQDDKEERRTGNPRNLEINDIIWASWGYEQTNINYYTVIELVGKQSVKLIEIGKTEDYNSKQMTGFCVPDLDNIIGKPFTRRVVEGSNVSVNSIIYAGKLRYVVDDGKRIYKQLRYSIYA